MEQRIVDELATFANPLKVTDSMRFFKTGEGDYGEGDCFLGIKVPDTRKVVKRHFAHLTHDQIEPFLGSSYHEHRLFALLVLVAQYQSKKFIDQRESIYCFYIDHTPHINNWDLVDVSASHIVGKHLMDGDKALLYRFAHSTNLWQKRIAIIATFAFIDARRYEDTLNISDILLHDTHDLIHKAVGWAIRKVGDGDLDIMLTYLAPRYQTMPRTMLRYAIEKLEEGTRQKYLKGLV